MNRTLLLALFSLVPAALQAESATPSLGYAGVPSITPGDHGGQDCSTCHSSFGGANSDPAGSLTVAVSDYVPGIQQMIRVIVQHPQATQVGFQMTIRQVSDPTQSAGTLSPVTPGNSPLVQVVCDDGSQFGSQGPCSAGTRQFAEHKNAPRGFADTSFEFDVPWDPPEFEVGKLYVYVAAVAANGDGTPGGDRVYTAVQSIANAGTCGLTRRPITDTAENQASLQPAFSSNSLISITGRNFAAPTLTRTAGAGDFVNNAYPTELACVSVQATGPGISQPVLIPITYVQQDLINAQMPVFSGTGPVTLQIILNLSQGNQLTGDVITLTALQPFAPAFFLFANSNSIAAQFTGTLTDVANPAVVAGGRPAQPGDIITLYGTGFGDTQPSVPTGQWATGLAPLVNGFTVTIGTVTLAPADITYAGLLPFASGLYIFEVRVPDSTPNGDVPVSISIGGFQTQTPATIPVQQ